MRRPASTTLIAYATLCLLGSMTGQARAAAPPDPPKIEVLSNTRADLVSGGDALIRITLPERAATWTPRVLIGNRKNVSDKLRRMNPRTLEGVVSGFKNGRNLLQVRLKDGTAAGLVVTNHPQGGPVFSGPQIQPWICQKTAVDEQCNEPPEYHYEYKSTNPLATRFLPYDRKHPPTDVAKVKTVTGEVVPFVIRVETGYIARDQYKIAVLLRPGWSWNASSPPPQFTGRLMITHGGNCDVQFGPDDAPSVTNATPIPKELDFLSPLIGQNLAETAFARGYAVMSTAADNSGHNCNLVTQAESLMMAKERLIEQYGKLRYTIGVGCSGGALAMYWIANAYPGIYDGILPSCSFSDAMTAATQVMDYHLLRRYFENFKRWFGYDAFTLEQTSLVHGSPTPINAIISDIGFYDGAVPERECEPLKPEQVYSPISNPDGVRCGLADFNVNALGRRDPSVWSAAEKKVGHGFANMPVDNVGVQYGLSALQAGRITPRQFVDLNAEIGGVDVDTNWSPQRFEGAAFGTAYRTGAINVGNNLDQTPIIDCRGPDPAFAHDAYRAFAIRARMDQVNGHHDNQLIYSGTTVMIGDVTCWGKSFDDMQRWVEAIKADTRDVAAEEKVRQDRPADMGDICMDGGRVVSQGVCGPDLLPVYGTPRTVAGDSLTTQTNKCQLMPLDRSSYNVTFSESQWQQLVDTFPKGVCDYSKPPVGYQPTVQWMEYGDAKGRVVTGGRPMGPAPASFGM